MIEGFEIKLVPTENYGRATVNVQMIASDDDQPQTPMDIFTDVITVPAHQIFGSSEQWIVACLQNLTAYLERQVANGEYHTLGDLTLHLHKNK